MAGSFIPTSLQKAWNEWNIRCFMILSLSVQVLLGPTAPLRKKSANRSLVFVIWSAYFTADWAATFTLGLITNAQLRDLNDAEKVDDNHLALWAAFLLIHLGGPDMITAYSLEDNALWKRHLVGLIAQLCTFIYIFLNTLPDNNLWAATILIAVAGTIKYEGRTRALYLASMGNLKKSIEKLADPSVDLSNVDPPDFSLEKIEGFFLFHIFKGLFVDIMPNHAERSKSLEIILSKEASGAYDIIETELDLLYDLFYTKMLAVDSRWGKLARIGAGYTLFAALLLYFLSKKEGYHEVDVVITYLLMAGAIFLDTLSIFMMALSKLSNLKRMTGLLDLACASSMFPLFVIPSLAIIVLLAVLEAFRGSRQFLRRSWCKYLGAFNLVCDSYGQYERGDNKVKKFVHAGSQFFSAYGDISRNPFTETFWSHIFHELKRRALFANDAHNVNAIFSSRGGWTLSNLGNCNDLMRYVDHSDYDKCLLVWHVATDICFVLMEPLDGTEADLREVAKNLSDYMNYLLTKKPELMSAVSGMGHKTYCTTLRAMTHLHGQIDDETRRDFFTRVVDVFTSIEPSHVNQHRDTSVISEACNLAKALMLKDRKWEIISGVWVEILMYAAGHCRPEKHAQVLIEGGELVTFIWLLMAHFGIGPHFPYPED